jgi:predicted RNA-binding protein YlxR (DUF448 family)
VRLALSAPGPGRRPLVIDRDGSLPGRGAYLCASAGADAPMVTPAADCLAAATRRGGLDRAFRTPVSVTPDFVESTST